MAGSGTAFFQNSPHVSRRSGSSSPSSSPSKSHERRRRARPRTPTVDSILLRFLFTQKQLKRTQSRCSTTASEPDEGASETTLKYESNTTSSLDLVLRYGDRDFAVKVAKDDDDGAAFFDFMMVVDDMLVDAAAKDAVDAVDGPSSIESSFVYDDAPRRFFDFQTRTVKNEQDLAPIQLRSSSDPADNEIKRHRSDVSTRVFPTVPREKETVGE